jgi:hypothetical protein
MKIVIVFVLLASILLTGNKIIKLNFKLITQDKNKKSTNMSFTSSKIFDALSL